MIRLALTRETQAVRRLVALLRGQLGFLPAAVGLGLLAFLVEGFGFSLFIPLLQAFADAHDAATAAGPLSHMIHGLVGLVPAELRMPAVVLGIFAAIVLKNVVQYANTTIFVVADARASDMLRRRVFAHVLALPMATVERDSSGRLMNALGTETWRVSQALGVLFGTVTSLCALAVFVPLLLLLSWKLTLLALGCMAVIPIVLHVIGRYIAELGREAVAANNLLAKRMWSSLAGIRVIRAFNQEGYESERFAAASEAVRRTFTRLSLITAVTGPATEILITAIIVAIALGMNSGLVDLPILAAFVALLYRLQPHVRRLAGSRVALLGLQAAVDEIASVLAEPEDRAVRRGGLAFAGLREAVRFEGVTFIYPGAAESALVDVSLSIPRGATVAIVGPSGAGKSTLLDLVLGFYTPQAGVVLVDGLPLERFDMTSWRARLAVVGQDPYVFDASVRENLLYGRPDAGQAELEDTARLAYAEDFIRRLPAGWDTVVGERGVRLSGGQRQRLAIARALIRRPDLLLLDEATNALDSRTERAVLEALARHGGERTVLIVTHRLATIQHADLIVVVDRGRVVESDDFATLVRADRLFAQMYRLQSLERSRERVA